MKQEDPKEIGFYFCAASEIWSPKYVAIISNILLASLHLKSGKSVCISLCSLSNRFSYGMLCGFY